MKLKISFSLLIVLIALAILGVPSLRAEVVGKDIGAPNQTRWIWTQEKAKDNETIYFRKSFEVPADIKITDAKLTFTVDDRAHMFLNGKQAGKRNDSWSTLQTVDVAEMLVPGINTLACEAFNGSSAAGVVAWLDISIAKKEPIVITTDSTWKFSSTKQKAWILSKFDDSAWALARELGPISMAPWGDSLSRDGTGLVRSLARKEYKPLNSDQAKQLLEADWLYQVDNRPSRKKTIDEITRSIKLADRLAADPDKHDFAKERTELAALDTKLQSLPDDIDNKSVKDIYLAVRAIKRAIMFKNPALDFDKVLLLDTPDYNGKHESAHRNGHGYGNRSGSRLLILEGLRPDGKEHELLSPEQGYVMRMDLSFDAKQIVFGMNPVAEKSFHLYEIDLDDSLDSAIKVSSRRQLTNSNYDDMDPVYLPDGHIIFSTSRGHSYVRCLPPSESTVLARCESDGSNIYIISRNNEPDYTPTVLPDGRILYTRWEYTERPLWRLQKLWTINPDGTGESLYWGNNSAYPDMLWEARPVPGTTRVMFAGVGHHDVMTSCLGVLDVREGLDWPNGITKLTVEKPWPEVGDPQGETPVTSPDYYQSGHYWSYRSPYPIGENDFLVSIARERYGRFDLFLMDIHGNRELIYTGVNNSWYARPFRPRQKPPIIPDRVAWPKKGEKAEDGVLFSQNVYYGTEGIPEGKAKYLRVIEMDAKTYSSGFKSWRHSGPVISVIQEDGVKRILGDVPIQADGSVSFKVPSGRALHFQLLDEHRRCIQIMRSFTGVMPGETRGCLGCHGMTSASPQAQPKSTAAMALRQPPAELTPPPWGAETSVSYERFCQPILDKYCGKCHQGAENPKAKNKLDLTLRGGLPEGGVTDPKLLPFKEPYLTLVGPAWNSPIKDNKAPGVGLAGCLNVEQDKQYGPLKPMTMLSSTSPLIAMAMSGEHHKVKIEGDDLLKLIAWVDCNCVYRGDEEVRMLPDPEPQIADRFPVPVKIKTAPVINRLDPVSDPKPSPTG